MYASGLKVSFSFFEKDFCKIFKFLNREKTGAFTKQIRPRLKDGF